MSTVHKEVQIPAAKLREVILQYAKVFSVDGDEFVWSRLNEKTKATTKKPANDDEKIAMHVEYYNNILLPDVNPVSKNKVHELAAQSLGVKHLITSLKIVPHNGGFLEEVNSNDPRVEELVNMTQNIAISPAAATNNMKDEAITNSIKEIDIQVKGDGEKQKVEVNVQLKDDDTWNETIECNNGNCVVTHFSESVGRPISPLPLLFDSLPAPPILLPAIVEETTPVRRSKTPPPSSFAQPPPVHIHKKEQTPVDTPQPRSPAKEPPPLIKVKTQRPAFHSPPPQQRVIFSPPPPRRVPPVLPSSRHWTTVPAPRKVGKAVEVEDETPVEQEMYPIKHSLIQPSTSVVSTEHHIPPMPVASVLSADEHHIPPVPVDATEAPVVIKNEPPPPTPRPSTPIPQQQQQQQQRPPSPSLQEIFDSIPQYPLSVLESYEEEEEQIASDGAFEEESKPDFEPIASDGAFDKEHKPVQGYLSKVHTSGLFGNGMPMVSLLKQAQAEKEKNDTYERILEKLKRGFKAH